MPSDRQESDFNAVFRLRTKRAREAAGFTQAEAAKMLDVERDTYKKWENRPTSAIPREKLMAFCLIMRVDVKDMLDTPSRQEILEVHPPLQRKA